MSHRSVSIEGIRHTLWARLHPDIIREGETQAPFIVRSGGRPEQGKSPCPNLTGCSIRYPPERGRTCCSSRKERGRNRAIPVARGA